MRHALTSTLLGLTLVAATQVGAHAAVLEDTAIRPAAVSIAMPVLHEAFVPAEPEVGARLAEAVEERTRYGIVYLPKGFTADAPFDLVMHFHGNPVHVIRGLEEAKVNAAALIVNLGVGSGVYERMYSVPVAFDASIDAVRDVIDVRLGTSPQVGRIAVSGWSAGYGAISHLLSRPESRDMIDAVLIADGMHASFLDPWRQQVHPLKMAPFENFAHDAAAGRKLFAVAHTAIETYAYASTTRTADYLLDATDTVRNDVDELRGGLELRTRGDHGGLHVRGYAGGSKQAHIDQLTQIGDTVLPMLAARWND